MITAPCLFLIVYYIYCLSLVSVMYINILFSSNFQNNIHLGTYKANESPLAQFSASVFVFDRKCTISTIFNK